ncbi:hypothetical protein [Paenibacillus paeoniae]|uniref:Uncharacterized protein n=1 Tax=Paenibacillus paeoniae TaxID=2292705 RepID=A0A371PMD1_9BACL|nr:hypothetical protein [Paenibacillus paeoniae]REK77370.1 hypothetical protein DX130_10325 [Paenibacillus paeoniae]
MELYWTAVWFITNMLFVASIITFLFMHRFVTQSQLQGAGAERIGTLKRRRTFMAIISMVTFIAMCASFVINMKVNG